MAGRFLVAVAFCPLVLAFSGTVPLIAWSSHRSNALDHLSLHDASDSLALVESITLHENVCEHDAVVLISQPGLLASDLRMLSPFSELARSLVSSPSSPQFPYVPSHPELNMTHIAHRLSLHCGSQAVELSPGQGSYLSQGSKHVFSINMPTIEASGALRKGNIRTYETQLADALSHITPAFPNHLIIYTGSSLPPSLLSRRQAPSTTPSRPILENVFQADTALAGGGVLKHYQLLTPGLIMVLLVALFVLVPVLMIGFTALASIQSPLQVAPPKGYSATEKKTQ